MNLQNGRRNKKYKKVILVCVLCSGSYVLIHSLLSTISETSVASVVQLIVQDIPYMKQYTQEKIDVSDKGA